MIEEYSSIQVIRPSPLLGWGGAVVAIAVTCGAAVYIDVPWIGPFGPLVWVAAMLLFLEELWRKDLRPRLMWNDGGLVIVDSRTTHRLRWSEVKVISTRGNKLSIRGPSGVIEQRFEGGPWRGTISRTVDEPPNTIEGRLRAAQERGLRRSDVAPPEPPRVRRPWILYVVAAIALAASVAYRHSIYP